jgi:hypothetical protein
VDFCARNADGAHRDDRGFDLCINGHGASLLPRIAQPPPSPPPPPVARPASPGALIRSNPASCAIDGGSLSASRRSLPVPSCRHGEKPR